MKKIISLMCVITLLFSMSVIGQACSSCQSNYTSWNKVWPTQEIYFSDSDNYNVNNSNTTFLRLKKNANYVLWKLDLTKYFEAFHETKTYSAENYLKLARFEIYANTISSGSDTAYVAFYDVPDFDWSAYKDIHNFVQITEETQKPFTNANLISYHQDCDSLTPVKDANGNEISCSYPMKKGWNNDGAGCYIDLTQYIRDKVEELKNSSSKIITIGMELVYGADEYGVSGPGVVSTTAHPVLKLWSLNNNGSGNAQHISQNRATTVTDPVVFRGADENGVVYNYVFAKFISGGELVEVNDLGITVNGTWYSIIKDGDTAQLLQAKTKGCFGIGIRDTGKTLGDTYIAVPKVKIKDYYKNILTDGAYAISGASKTVENEY